MITKKNDGFQKTVIGLTKSIKTVETKVLKNEFELLIVKDKVIQNKKEMSMNSRQQEELKKLVDERLNSTSYALPGIRYIRQGLTIESVLVGQAKYTAAIQLGNQPTLTLNGDLVQICTICYNVSNHI